MLDRIDTDTIRYLFNFQVQVTEPVEQQLLERRGEEESAKQFATRARVLGATIRASAPALKD